jgi:predicted nucleotidyltransferase
MRLRQVTRMAVYSIEQIKHIVEPIARSHGVERVMLFGSYARGDATENSDIDFHIDAGNVKDLFALSGFMSDLEEALAKKVDVVTSGGIRPKFYDRIKGDEVILYGA